MCIFLKSDNEARYCGAVEHALRCSKSPHMRPTARPALLLSFTESPGPDSPSPSQTLTLLLLFSLFPNSSLSAKESLSVFENGSGAGLPW